VSENSALKTLVESRAFVVRKVQENIRFLEGIRDSQGGVNVSLDASCQLMKNLELLASLQRESLTERTFDATASNAVPAGAVRRVA